MKKVERFKLTKTHKILIILAASFVLLLAAYLIINAALKNQGGGEDPAEPPYYDASVGEVLYLGNAVAYSPVENKDIVRVYVTGKDGDFVISRWPDENGSFMIWYDNDGDGELSPYSPPITVKENDFDYESLYAVESEDGFGRIYLLTYLCAALNSPIIKDRIALPKATDEQSTAKRNLILKNYGFEADKIVGISFDYGEGGKSAHNIVLGGRALSDSGFYFMVDGRDYIYYTGSNYFEYATRGVSAFVKGLLVSEGLDGDSTYEPYLTPSFKEWVNTQHKKDKDAAFGPLVQDGSTVIATGSIFELDPKAEGGYSVLEKETLTFDLKALKDHPDFERIKAALVGREVGFNYSAAPISFTLTYATRDGKLIDFGDAESVLYSYTVTEIEAVLTEMGEIAEKGTPVSNNSTVKIAYTYTVAGKAAEGIYHAVVDLSENPAFSEKLSGLSVGVLLEAERVDVLWTRENAEKTERRLYVSDILAIYDATGAVAEEVGESSYVKLRYYEEINGVKSEEKIVYLSLLDIKEGTDSYAIKKAIVGKKKGAYEGAQKLLALENVSYYETLCEFDTYSVSDIRYFVTSELVVSFGFVKKVDDRDPYYGESFYENKLDGKYSLYGLNAATCEAVVRVLGGIADDSTQSVGLSGKTVAIGLTPEIMDKYGLYAYTVYFVLPRGIYDASEESGTDSQDKLSDYDWYGELGFTLYISEEDPETGKRYVGSDMYDLVAEIDGEGFEFLNFGFSEFWARRNLVMLDISNVDRLKIELDMKDVKGEYDFDLNMETVWGGVLDGKEVISGAYQEGFTKLNMLYVNITEGEGSTETALSRYFASTGKSSVSATEFYNQVVGGGNSLYEPGTIDSVGTANFKVFFELLQLIRYEGVLTAEEQAAAANAPKLMSLRLKINQKSFYYSYDFYRIDDRKIMVRVYESDAEGNRLSGYYASEFYVNTFGFKKLVGGLTDFLNTETVDLNSGYPD